MPTYDYRCETNGQVVEVKHGMSEVLKTWGYQAGCRPAPYRPFRTDHPKS